MYKNNPWALITGANGGVGLSLVRVFEREGYRVIATDQQSQYASSAFEGHYIQADLEQITRSPECAQTLFCDVEHATGGEGVTVLINNAAVQNLGSLETQDRQSWHNSLSVNLLAPFFLIQGLAGSLEKNSGSVVNISSIHANQTKPGFFTYSTTKAALSALSRSLAVSVGSGFRINAIEPAAVNTEMLVEAFTGKTEHLKSLHAYHPAGRIAEPEEVAELALFLCSNKARFIHGECISLSGGIDGRLHDPE